MPDRTAENAGNGKSQRRLKTDGAGLHGGSPGHRFLRGGEEWWWVHSPQPDRG